MVKLVRWMIGIGVACAALGIAACGGDGSGDAGSETGVGGTSDVGAIGVGDCTTAEAVGKVSTEEDSRAVDCDDPDAVSEITSLKPEGAEGTAWCDTTQAHVGGPLKGVPNGVLVCIEEIGGGENASSPADAGAGPDRPAISSSRVVADCSVGEEPNYYVPSESTPRIAACVELGVSGRTMEMSVNNERHLGEQTLCLHPAFAGYGKPGGYIPAICVPDPPDEIHIVRYEIPTQGVRGYELVLWGVARRTKSVTATYGGSEAAAAVFPAPSGVSPKGTDIFAVELPVEAGCDDVIVEGNGGDTDRARPIGRTCQDLD